MEINPAPQVSGEPDRRHTRSEAPKDPLPLSEADEAAQEKQRKKTSALPALPPMRPPNQKRDDRQEGK